MAGRNHTRDTATEGPRGAEGSTPTAALLDDIFKRQRVRDAGGTEFPLQASISPREGRYLDALLAGDETLVSTLEIGCAFGLSSLYICEAIRHRPSAKHTIVDPYQFGDKWHGVGVANLERAGIDFFSLVEEPSEVVLPRLLAEGPGRFDFVFIDGWHTFDQVMVELFYATRLLRVGGYVALDDASFLGVAHAIAYFANYPAFRLLAPVPVPKRLTTRKRAIASRIPSGLARRAMPADLFSRYQGFRFGSLTALQKVAEDDRHSAWFGGF